MFKVRLLTLMLLTWCLVATIYCLQASSKYSAAKKELQQLRSQLGYLAIIDKTKLNVVNVTATQPELRWRVFVPERKVYRLVFRTNPDPLNAKPLTKFQTLDFLVHSDEYVVSSSVTCSDGDWLLNVGVGDSCIKQLPLPPWFDEETHNFQQHTLSEWSDVSDDGRLYKPWIAGSKNSLSHSVADVSDGDLLLAEWAKNGKSLQLWLMEGTH